MATPAAPRGRQLGEHSQVAWLRACGLACAFALIVLTVAGVLQSGRGLWQDESTLLANLGLPLPVYFGNLPFYDQAAPPLALLTLDAVYLLAGKSLATMRLLLLAGHVALLAGFAIAAYRRGDREVLLAIAIMAVTPLMIRYCLELKQYGFELQAGFVFLVLLRWLPGRPALVMALAGVLSFFSFSIMLLVGVATLDAIAFRFDGALRRRWFVLLVIYCVAWVACYLLLFRPATALQTANYPTAYERLPLALYLQQPKLLITQFEVIARAQAGVAMACGLAAAALLGLLAWRSKAVPDIAWSPGAALWQPVRLFIGLVAIVGVLWLAKLYPVSTNKQFLFTMPIGALLVANLVVATATMTRQTRAVPLALAVMLVPSAAKALSREWTRETDLQDTQGLYAFVKSQGPVLILPDLLFEPTLRHYVARDPQPPTRVAGWLLAESRPMETPKHAVAHLGAGAGPIYQHVWQPLDTVHAYPAYLDWLVRQRHGASEAIIAAAHIDPNDEAAVLRSARRQGCNSRVEYKSRGVVAYRITCPQALVR